MNITDDKSLSRDFLSESLSLTNELLKDILLDIQAIDSFTAEKEFHWNRQVMKLTTDIGVFVEMTTLLSKVVMKQKSISLPDIKNSHIHLLFVMKGIHQYQQKLDSVLLEDLIKYELNDNLTQWKIDLLPQIKRLISA